MKTRKRQYGRGPWRQGQDTCVFQPVVNCVDGPSKYKDGYVSRITDKDDRTFKVENLLKSKFPELVDAGWVTAFVKSCQPKYTPEDRKRDENFVREYGKTKGACNEKVRADNRSAPKHINLISKKLGETYYNRPNPTNKVDHFQELRNAISACVELLPDDGPLIIHTDLHANNILYNEETKNYALHDWGRTLVIRNPNSKEGFVKDCRDFVDEVYPPAVWGKIPSVWQMPPYVIKVLQHIYDTGELSDKDKNIIKSWTIFVIIATGFNKCRLTDTHRRALREDLIAASTQDELRKVVNKHIKKVIGIDNYVITKPKAKSKSPSPAPIEQKTRKRSLKPCKPGHARNPATNRCKKIPKSKAAVGPGTPEAPKPDAKPCPEGKIRNPQTNRCVKIDGKIGKRIA